MRLRAGHQYSQFWPILARFMDYYSLFWGPGVIFMIDKPRGAFSCQSSTLTILADSVPFHVLLLTVLGVPERFPRLTIPRVPLRVRRQTLIVLPNSDQHPGLLLTVLGSRSNFHSCLNPRCAYVSVINTRCFGRVWPVSWTITHYFEIGRASCRERV